MGLGAAYVPGGDASVMMQRPFIGNLLTSDPVRYARNVAVIEAEPALVDRLADRGLDGRRPSRRCGSSPIRAFPSKIRQPMLIIAAGHDQLVSTPAIDEFAVRLRAGSHLIVPGSRHEILMEQDHFRDAGPGRLRRLRAGHAAVA